MLTSALVGLIAAVAIFNQARDTHFLLVFSASCTLMLIIGNELSPLQQHYYYAACALAHLIVISLIEKENKISDLIYHLFIINLAFIYLNLFGLWMNFYYISPIYYNIGCEVLYSLVLVAVFYNWCCNGLWTTGIHRITSFFRGNMRSSLPQLCLSKEEEGT